MTATDGEMVSGADSGGAVAHDHGHPSVRTYVIIAVTLAVLTALEVMVFYIEALVNVLVAILIVLSAAKFALVVMFYMHLKFDANILRGLFLGPLVIATAIILALVALYGHFA